MIMASELPPDEHPAQYQKPVQCTCSLGYCDLCDSGSKLPIRGRHHLPAPGSKPPTIAEIAAAQEYQPWLGSERVVEGVLEDIDQAVDSYIGSCEESIDKLQAVAIAGWTESARAWRWARAGWVLAVFFLLINCIFLLWGSL